MKVARLFLAPVAGLFFFLFIAVDLLLFGVIPLDSNLIPGLALAGLAIGLLIAVYGLFRAAPAPPAPVAAAAPAAPAAATMPAAEPADWGAPAVPETTTAPAVDDEMPPPPPPAT